METAVTDLRGSWFGSCSVLYSHKTPTSDTLTLRCHDGVAVTATGIILIWRTLRPSFNIA